MAEEGGGPQARPYTPSARRFRTTTGTLGAAAIAVEGWTFWSSRGSRLALFICAGAVALVVIDAVAALVWTARVGVTMNANTADAIVGDVTTASLYVSGHGGSAVLIFPSTDTLPWVVDPPTTGSINGEARERGVGSELVMEVVSTGLCGLVSVSRRRVVPFAVPLLVGPRPLAPPTPFPDLGGSFGEGRSRAGSGDIVRGVRPYTPGDSVRHVHWRATAHTGQIVVKELEAAERTTLTVVLDLGSGGPGGEAAAGRASWYADEGLRRGYSVVLVTFEPGRVRSEPVTSSLEISRQLATATAVGGDPQGLVHTATPPLLIVSERGDSWR